MATKKTNATAGSGATTEKFPELRAQLVKLEAERDQLRKKVAPARKRRDALLRKLQPLETKVRELDAEIQAIERPRLAQLDNQIAALHRAMGAKSFPVEGA